MENSSQMKQDYIKDAQSQQIIQRIMNYAPPTYHGSQFHSQPLIEKFNVEYLTNILDRNKIQSIDKVYRSKQDGFNLLEFIRFFLNVIQHEEIETLYLSIALIDFFKEISQSCGYKDHLHFIDITNYICNRILEKRNQENQIQSKFVPDYRTIIPNFKIKDYLLNPPSIYSSKDELVYKLSLNKIKIDKMKHEGVITNCYFSSSLMKVFTLDDLSDSISVYNTSCGLIKRIKPNFSKLKKDIVVLSFAYSERQQRIGAVLKDFSINFWDHSDNFQFQKSISTASFCQQYQTNIWFFEYFNSWVTSDKTGYLYIWNLQTEKPERKIKLAMETQINDLAVIPCINLIAVVQERKIFIQTKSSAADKRKRKKNLYHQNSENGDIPKKQNQHHQNSTIYLYDYFKGQVVTKIQLGPQNRNPHTLQYSQNYQVLLSAGYEKKITIFQINKTFLDTNKKGQLTGHQSLITSFTLIKKSPMVISADDKGKVKIWDIRNYKCVQTLDFRDKTNITKLLDMIELGKVGVLGSRINFVEFDEKTQIQKRIHNKDKAVPLKIECDYATQQLIVLTKKDIRIIDLRKGVVKNIYCQFHAEDIEITFFKYFQALKKFVIGNEKGQIRIYCIRTGKLEGRLIEHAGSITHIQYDQQNKIFITMGQDSTIQIQKPFMSISQTNGQNYNEIGTKKIKQTNQIGNQGYRYNISKKKNSNLNRDDNLARSRSEGTLNSSKNNTFGENSMETQGNTRSDPNIILLRQIKNNFNGKQLTLACVSIYHGFIAVGSSQKNVYIWDYEFCKLLIEINLPEIVDTNIEPTSLAFINGYSILVVGTSEGTAYFIKISRLQQSFNIKTIGIFRSSTDDPITTITTDLLIKGFSIDKQKFIHCKIYLGHSSGLVTSIDLSQKIAKLKQQQSLVHKPTFNAERQLRENFVTQIQKKKYQSYTINENIDQCVFGQIIAQTKKSKMKNGQISAVILQAHKGHLSGLNVVQLDECFLLTIGMDERIKVWKENKLLCDWNINLPLPFKWDIRVKNEQKKRQKIMFALKIIQQIFLKYGSEISINQSKSLKVRKLLDRVKGELQQDIFTQGNRNNNFITEPHQRKQTSKTSEKIILFQNQFSKKDMHYDYVKKFNFNQVAGPTLREIEVQKKLDMIQKQWSINKEKVQQDKNKLLMVIRNKAQKNEEKQQILQFMQPKNYLYQKSKDRQSKDNFNSPFVKNIMSKIQFMMAPKSAKKDGQGSETTGSGLGYKMNKDNYTGFLSLQKCKMSSYQQKTLKNIDKQQKKQKIAQKQKTSQKKDKQYCRTFQNYFEQKQVQNVFDQKQNIFNDTSRKSDNNNGFNKTSSNFRNILNKMNERINQSKKRRIRQNIVKDDDQLNNNQRFLAIATSDGRRNVYANI